MNWAGVLLIALGVGLLVAEGYVTSYGLMGLGGVASLVLGALMLFDSPLRELRVGWAAILPTVVVLVVTSLLLASRALRLRRRGAITGLEAMVG